jgi:DNA-binding protein HU-beta
MESYGKTNLIEDLTARTSGITRTQITQVLDQALGLIQEQVKTDKRVTIPGFGTWQKTQRAARRGTNLRTKQPIQIPASTSVRFTPGSTFKATVSGKSSGGAYAKERAVGSALGKRIKEKVKGRSAPAR